MSTNTTTNNQQDLWKQKELGVFWKRTKQNSKETYLTGTINLKALGFDKDVAVVVFSNKSKQKDTHPDLRMYISEKKGESGTVVKAAVTPAPAAKSTTKPAQKQPVQQVDPELI